MGLVHYKSRHAAEGTKEYWWQGRKRGKDYTGRGQSSKAKQWSSERRYVGPYVGDVKSRHRQRIGKYTPLGLRLMLKKHNKVHARSDGTSLAQSR